MMVGYFKTKFELVEIKEHSHKQISKTIKVSKSIYHLHKCIQKVKYIQRNVTTLQQHIKWHVSRIPTFIGCDGHTNAFFDKVEIMYQAI
jgi:hypothetical protein